MILDDAREYVVIVNEGSGCIFQPANTGETYILTAKHNIEKAGNQIDQLIRFKFENGFFKDEEIEINDLVIGENYFPHPENDISIIKIGRVKGLNRLLKVDNLDKKRSGYVLLGYPKVRRDDNEDCCDWFRADEGIQITITQNLKMKEAKVPGNPTHAEMLGQSGGGIFKVNEEQDYISVAGVLNRIAKADENEQLGYVGITPIHVFSEIINDNRDKLSSLSPFYLESFSFLDDKVFNLDAGISQGNIDRVKVFLKQKANEVVQSDITPKGIKSFFRERLLIEIELKEELDCEKIWVIWLEFLTILNLVKDKVHSEDELSEIFDSYRLLFTNSKEKFADEMINKLMYSDYMGLKENGTVIIGHEKSPRDGQFIIEPGKITPDISNPAEMDKEMRIDDGLLSPFDEYRFIHKNFFTEESIERRHQEYAELRRQGEIIDKLKEVYYEVFR